MQYFSIAVIAIIFYMFWKEKYGARTDAQKTERVAGVAHITANTIIQIANSGDSEYEIQKKITRKLFDCALTMQDACKRKVYSKHSFHGQYMDAVINNDTDYVTRTNNYIISNIATDVSPESRAAKILEFVLREPPYEFNYTPKTNSKT